MKKTSKFLTFGDRQMIRCESIISLQILPKEQNQAFKHLSFDGESTPDFVLGIILKESGDNLHCIVDREAALFLEQYRDYFDSPYPELFEVIISNYYTKDF